MAGTSTVRRQRPANVPRLALPFPDGAAPGAVDTPAYNRQINVALGRSHSKRTPRRDVIFGLKHGGMVEKQRVPLTMQPWPCDGSDKGSMANNNMIATPRTHWMTSYEAAAPAFSPSVKNEPKGRWYEQADKVFRFFGYIVDQVEPTTRQAPGKVRLVIILFYPQDNTLEMLESKETAIPGVGRSFALRRPSRVSLDDIRVGADVLINGTRVRVYDADGFTRRSIPGLRPAERAPVADNSFSITPRREPQSPPQGSGMLGSCGSPARMHGGGGGGTGSLSRRSWHSWDGASSSILSEDSPGFLRMYIRWDETDNVASPIVHRYILHFYLEDGTVEMRELADIKGGNHFQRRFPVMIRRQKVFKGGGSPSLSVDCIGGDRADASGGTTSRSARVSEYDCDGGGIGRGSSVESMPFGGGGAGSGEDGDVGQPLTPVDLTVGRQVLLMKRPMTVCGWDETAHVWWESLTGKSMRGLQGNLEEFQRCIRPGQAQPRRPTKPKPSFYEGPPQRSGTVQERFFKASENSGKTLRFLAKATEDSKTTSTRDNVFIIRFYPADDSLSVYTTHNLGSNSGGLYKGVYLSRTCDMINEDTGEPFQGRDFYVGSIAKLRSVSLEVVDVDDFTRQYLARHTPPSDRHWQTAPMWAKLLDMATATGAGAGVEAAAAAAAATAAADSEADTGSFPRPPAKSVTFDGSDDYGNGGAAVLRQLDTNDAVGRLSSTTRFSETAEKQRDRAGWSGPESLAIFARLWAECVGDNTCAAFTPDDGSVPGGSGGKKSSASPGPAVASVPPQQAPAHSNRNHHPLRLWERLTVALRDERGIDVSRALTAHERTLLEREVADWLGRSQGRTGRPVGNGKGMTGRLASAAAAALRQKDGSTPVAMATWQNEPTGAAAAAARERGSGGIPNPGRRRLSVGGHDFPAVVVEESSPPSPVGGGGTTNAGTDGSRAPSGAAGDGATATTPQKPGRQLDLRAVALDAHEAPASGRDDKFVQRALEKVLAHVFGHGGDEALLRTLKAEKKTPGDPADMWTMCRLLKIVAEVSRRETEALWLKFMPNAVAKAGEGKRVTFAGFLGSIEAFEACLRRGEILGLSSTGQDDNYAGPVVAEEGSKRWTPPPKP